MPFFFFLKFLPQKTLFRERSQAVFFSFAPLRPPLGRFWTQFSWGASFSVWPPAKSAQPP